MTIALIAYLIFAFATLTFVICAGILSKRCDEEQ